MTIRKISEVTTGFVASTLLLALPTLISAQTTTTPPPPKKPAATTPAKPVAKTAVATTPATTAKPVAATTNATTVKPVAATTATPAKRAATPAAAATTTTTTTGQSASQIVQPASSTVIRPMASQVRTSFPLPPARARSAPFQPPRVANGVPSACKVPVHFSGAIGRRSLMDASAVAQESCVISTQQNKMRSRPMRTRCGTA